MRTTVTANAGCTVDAVTLRIVDDLDIVSADGVRAALDTVLDLGAVDITVDLDGCSFIDAIGIGVLVGAHRRVRQRDGRLTLASPRPVVRRVLGLTRIDELLPICTPDAPGGASSSGGRDPADEGAKRRSRAA